MGPDDDAPPPLGVTFTSVITGVILALDRETGEIVWGHQAAGGITGDIVWDTDLPGDSFGGATVVNDLVFTSVITGVILALDRETGEIVWGHQAAGGINGWPAVAGDTILIPVGFGDPGFLLALRLPR